MLSPAAARSRLTSRFALRPLLTGFSACFALVPYLSSRGTPIAVILILSNVKEKKSALTGWRAVCPLQNKPSPHQKPSPFSHLPLLRHITLSLRRQSASTPRWFFGPHSPPAAHISSLLLLRIREASLQRAALVSHNSLHRRIGNGPRSPYHRYPRSRSWPEPCPVFFPSTFALLIAKCTLPPARLESSSPCPGLGAAFLPSLMGRHLHPLRFAPDGLSSSRSQRPSHCSR